MNNEDKRLISDYMEWEIRLQDWWRPENDQRVNFDLNDAGLCVKKMQRQEDWDDFITYVEADDTECHTWSQFFALLYNADNFFEAMAKWLKEENK